MTINDKSITGVILAGGQARRMDNQDKGLVEVNGKPMIRLILDKLAPQVDDIVINANRNIETYETFGYPVISDNNRDDYHGPLAGMLSALKVCKTDYILTVPCDNPFLPGMLSARLLARIGDADICVAHDGERIQPVFALIKNTLTASLQTYLDNGDRKIDLWYQQHDFVTADFSDIPEISFNINTYEELQRLEKTMCEEAK